MKITADTNVLLRIIVDDDEDIGGAVKEAMVSSRLQAIHEKD